MVRWPAGQVMRWPGGQVMRWPAGQVMRWPGDEEATLVLDVLGELRAHHVLAHGGDGLAAGA